MKQEDLIGLAIGGIFVALIFIKLWPLIVGVLAFIGAYAIWTSQKK